MNPLYRKAMVGSVVGGVWSVCIGILFPFPLAIPIALAGAFTIGMCIGLS